MIVRFDQDRLLLVKIRTVCFRRDRPLSTEARISDHVPDRKWSKSVFVIKTVTFVKITVTFVNKTVTFVKITVTIFL